MQKHVVHAKREHIYITMTPCIFVLFSLFVLLCLKFRSDKGQTKCKKKCDLAEMGEYQGQVQSDQVE